MKPNPLLSLNHFTVPCAMKEPSLCYGRARRPVVSGAGVRPPGRIGSRPFAGVSNYSPTRRSRRAGIFALRSRGQMEAEGQSLAEYPLLVRLAERLHLADAPGPLGRKGSAIEPCRGPLAGEIVEVARAVAGTPGDLGHGERRVLDGTEVEVEQTLQPFRSDIGGHGVVCGRGDGNSRPE